MFQVNMMALCYLIYKNNKTPKVKIPSLKISNITKIINHHFVLIKLYVFRPIYINWPFYFLKKYTIVVINVYYILNYFIYIV
jgi:hypothetical protein